MKFAEHIRAWREREGLSQAEAAAKMRISKDTLQNWEIGRGPGKSVLRAIEVVFGREKAQKGAKAR